MGNEAYKDGNYPEAILNFNKAIEMTDHSECSFFRYRGLAFKKNGNIEPVYLINILGFERCFWSSIIRWN